MAAGYGYWIKIIDHDDGILYLDVEGTKVPGDKSIPLHKGWNLVGYLGNIVYYKGIKPDIPFVGSHVFLPKSLLWVKLNHYCNT